MKKPRYVIKQAVIEAEPGDPFTSDKIMHEVWRRDGLIQKGYLIDVFTREAMAQRACDVLNGLCKGVA